MQGIIKSVSFSFPDTDFTCDVIIKFANEQQYNSIVEGTYGFNDVIWDVQDYLEDVLYDAGVDVVPETFRVTGSKDVEGAVCELNLAHEADPFYACLCVEVLNGHTNGVEAYTLNVRFKSEEQYERIHGDFFHCIDGFVSGFIREKHGDHYSLTGLTEPVKSLSEDCEVDLDVSHIKI